MQDTKVFCRLRPTDAQPGERVLSLAHISSNTIRIENPLTHERVSASVPTITDPELSHLASRVFAPAFKRASAGISQVIIAAGVHLHHDSILEPAVSAARVGRVSSPDDIRPPLDGLGSLMIINGFRELTTYRAQHPTAVVSLKMSLFLVGDAEPPPPGRKGSPAFFDLLSFVPPQTDVPASVRFDPAPNIPDTAAHAVYTPTEADAVRKYSRSIARVVSSPTFAAALRAATARQGEDLEGGPGVTLALRVGLLREIAGRRSIVHVTVAQVAPAHTWLLWSRQRDDVRAVLNSVVRVGRPPMLGRGNPLADALHYGYSEGSATETTLVVTVPAACGVGSAVDDVYRVASQLTEMCAFAGSGAGLGVDVSAHVADGAVPPPPSTPPRAPQWPSVPPVPRGMYSGGRSDRFSTERGGGASGEGWANALPTKDVAASWSSALPQGSVGGAPWDGLGPHGRSSRHHDASDPLIRASVSPGRQSRWSPHRDSSTASSDASAGVTLRQSLDRNAARRRRSEQKTRLVEAERDELLRAVQALTASYSDPHPPSRRTAAGSPGNGNSPTSPPQLSPSLRGALAALQSARSDKDAAASTDAITRQLHKEVGAAQWTHAQKPVLQRLLAAVDAFASDRKRWQQEVDTLSVRDGARMEQMARLVVRLSEAVAHDHVTATSASERREREFVDRVDEVLQQRDALREGWRRERMQRERDASFAAAQLTAVRDALEKEKDARVRAEGKVSNRNAAAMAGSVRAIVERGKALHGKSRRRNSSRGSSDDYGSGSDSYSSRSFGSSYDSDFSDSSYD